MKAHNSVNLRAREHVVCGSPSPAPGEKFTKLRLDTLRRRTSSLIKDHTLTMFVLNNNVWVLLTTMERHMWRSIYERYNYLSSSLTLRQMVTTAHGLLTDRYIRLNDAWHEVNGVYIIKAKELPDFLIHIRERTR
jgi:hypothetical protein